MLMGSYLDYSGRAALEGAGLPVQARLERTSYPAEVETWRSYLLARRQAS
jgi:hypothetical protein